MLEMCDSLSPLAGEGYTVAQRRRMGEGPLPFELVELSARCPLPQAGEGATMTTAHADNG